MHISHDDLAVQASHGGQKEDNTLLQRSEHRHQGELMTMWTESLWAFPESYAANNSRNGCLSNGGQ